MNLFSFSANFGDETACRLHFKQQRDRIGMVCRVSHFWIKSCWSYECKSCRSRTSLKKRDYYAAFKFIIFDIVQNNVSDERNEKGIFGKRNSETAWFKAIRTGLGNGSQTAQVNWERTIPAAHCRE